MYTLIFIGNKNVKQIIAQTMELYQLPNLYLIIQSIHLAAGKQDFNLKKIRYLNFMSVFKRSDIAFKTFPFLRELNLSKMLM